MFSDINSALAAFSAADWPGIEAGLSSMVVIQTFCWGLAALAATKLRAGPPRMQAASCPTAILSERQGRSPLHSALLTGALVCADAQPDHDHPDLNGRGDPVSEKASSDPPPERDDRRPGLFFRANGPTLIALLVMHLIAVQTLTPLLAATLFVISCVSSGLAWLSMLADAQTMRRRGRPSPDRAALPAYAMAIGTFFSASTLAIWALAAL